MGYGKSVTELEEAAEKVIESEAVGVNLEDSLKMGEEEERCVRLKNSVGE
jgi:2-methylisocitrate lyase-like PEP mutase family enzyme